MMCTPKRVGLLVTHGTDTLSWTLPYVRYAVKNNHANICITGSQIPLPATSAFSDAFINIENSIHFMSSLTPPNIFAVFNYGRDAFSDSLRKIHKWDCIAFTGDAFGEISYNCITLNCSGIELNERCRMDKLHVISTGGTIDAEPDSMGILSPGANHALGYITTNFSHTFKDLSRDPVFSVDSSDMTITRMRILSEVIVACLNESFDDTYADCNFSEGVKIIYTDPMKKTDDYLREVEGARGVIIAGYGGGNVNIDTDSGGTVLPMIHRCIDEEIAVILTSQVPSGTADFIYRNASEALSAGAISSVDLSIPESQLRLAYILGHMAEIDAHVEKAGVTSNMLVKQLFMSGVKFRNDFSRRLFGTLTGFDPLKQDLLVDIPFLDAINAVDAK